MLALISVIFMGLGVGFAIFTREFDPTYFYLGALFAIAYGVNKEKKE